MRSDEATGPSLEEVYSSHAQLVWRLLRRQGLSDATCEDLLHDVFLVVRRRLHEYDGRAAMSTWLFHITRGVVSNFRRGRAREQRRLKLVRPEPARPPGPEERVRRREAAAFVRSFLARLDPDKRAVFELYEIDGLPMPEVAEICGTNVNTAHARLRAARRLFQEALVELRGAVMQSEAK